jgi:drug/metabolite transporter (DMT)-like permease
LTAESPPLENRRLFLILVLLNVFWAPVNLMVHWAVGDGATPSAIALVRWSCLGVLLGLALATPQFRRAAKARWPKPKDALVAYLVGMALFGPSHVLYYFALTKTSTFIGTVLNTTAPLWVAAFAFLFLKERAKPSRLLAIAVGFVGAWLVSVGLRLPDLGQGNTAGNLWYLLGVLSESAASVIAAHLIRRASGVTILWFQVLGAVTTLAFVPLLFGQALPFSLAGAGWPAAGALAYLVLISGLFNFGVWYTLVEKAPLSLMVVSVLLQPPLSALLGWQFLGERLTPLLTVGTGLILAALLIGSSERRSGGVAAEEVTEDEG